MEDWKQKVFLFEILGCIIYVVLIFLAMLFYPGGTPTNPDTQGYSFWENWLSDLGLIKSHSGENNIVSMIFFTIALTIWGLSLIPFFLALRTLFTEKQIEKILSTIGSFLGIIAAIGLIGIAYTPADILGLLHIIFVYIAYLSLFILGVLYSITLFRSKILPRQYAIVFLIWTVLFFLTLSMGIIGQKIGRFTTVICFALTGYGLWKMEKK
jgi:hypothetical protein